MGLYCVVIVHRQASSSNRNKKTAKGKEPDKLETSREERRLETTQHSLRDPFVHLLDKRQFESE